MAIDLLSLQPNKVSRDLSGYITYIYGPGGAGKTTFGASCKDSLLLAFEIGYKAIPGVRAQAIQTWGEVKQVLRELKKPEVKNVFKTIVVDTVDIASQLCEKYMCSQLGIENIGDGGWTTNGWAKAKKEWEQTWRAFTMEGYAVVFISHSKDKVFKRKDGSEYNQIVPSCPTAYEEIIKNMVDLMGYIDVNNGERKLVLRSADDSIDCKSRFKMIAPVITFGYNELVQQIGASHRLHIVVAKVELRNLVNLIFKHTTHKCCIEEYPRILFLTHHLIHRAIDHISELTHLHSIECRRKVGTNGR